MSALEKYQTGLPVGRGPAAAAFRLGAGLGGLGLVARADLIGLGPGLAQNAVDLRLNVRADAFSNSFDSLHK